MEVHLKQKLHNVWRGNRSIEEYVAEIKQTFADLACINVEVCDDDLVSVMLNGLGKDYKSLVTFVSVHGKMPDFDELVALCLQEEVKLGAPGASTSHNTTTQESKFFIPEIAVEMEVVESRWRTRK